MLREIGIVCLDNTNLSLVCLDNTNLSLVAVYLLRDLAIYSSNPKIRQIWFHDELQSEFPMQPKDFCNNGDLEQQI
ncbi:MAG: hypothetical protein ACTSX0_07530 [Promethearchaeota archaeon]